MGKRQIRIRGENCDQFLQEIMNVEANIIFKNNTTLTGRIISNSNDSFQMKDHRRNEHTLLKSSIEEIIIDKEASF